MSNKLRILVIVILSSNFSFLKAQDSTNKSRIDGTVHLSHGVTNVKVSDSKFDYPANSFTVGPLFGYKFNDFKIESGILINDINGFYIDTSNNLIQSKLKTIIIPISFYTRLNVGNDLNFGYKKKSKLGIDFGFAFNLNYLKSENQLKQNVQQSIDGGGLALSSNIKVGISASILKRNRLGIGYITSLDILDLKNANGKEIKRLSNGSVYLDLIVEF